MTEAGGGGGQQRAEFERALVQRSLEDDSFKRRLLDDPKGTVEQELGGRLPEDVEVRVVEESAQTIYLVLPSASPLGEGEELSDRELGEVAGGPCGCYRRALDMCFSVRTIARPTRPPSVRRRSRRSGVA